MPEDPAFIRAIAENPEDDAPRLVYADFLEETGEPLLIARAEFIRVQIERAYPQPDAARNSALWKRETELLGHAQAWRRSLPDVAHMKWGGFVRGFIERVDLLPRTLTYGTPEPEDRLEEEAVLDALEIACTHMPIRRITVNGARLVGAERFAAWPQLTQVYSLALAHVDVTFDGLEMILHSPKLSSLRKLDIRGIPLGAALVRMIVTSPWAGNLIALGLVENRLSASHARMLANCDSLTRLERLDVSGNAIPQTELSDLRTRFGNSVVRAW